MAITFEDYLSGLAPVTELLFQDASGAVADSGSAAPTWVMSGTPNYREGSYSGVFNDDSVTTKYWMGLDGLTSNDGMHTLDLSWMNSGAGSFVFVTDTWSTSNTIIAATGLAGGIVTNAFLFEQTGVTTFKLTIFGAGGVGVDSVEITWTYSSQPAAGLPQIFCLQQPGDGTGPQLWMNGVKLDRSVSTITTGDDDFWLDTIDQDCDGFAIGGYPIWTSGPTFSSLGDESAANLAYFGYFSRIFTAAELWTLNKLVWGDNVVDESTTRTGRNQMRRYWSNQIDGGTAVPGLGKVGMLWAGGGSSAEKYHFELLNAGTDIWVDITEDQEILQIFPFAGNGDSQMGTTLGPSCLPTVNGSVIVGQDGNGGLTGFCMYWQNGGWRLGTMDPMITLLSSPQWHGGAEHPDADGLVAFSGNLNPGSVLWPQLFAWDGAGHFDDVVSRFDSHGCRPSTNNHCLKFSPDGAWLAYGCGGNSPYTTVGDSPLNLWKITDTIASKDTFTWRNPYTSADLSFNTAYGLHFVTNAAGDLFLMVGSYAASSATLNVVVYAYTPGTDTWAKDTSIFNNAVNCATFDTNVTGESSIVSVGDDLYIGQKAAPTATYYENLWHLRWDSILGYYDEQTKPVWPHEQDVPQVGVGISDMVISSDGQALIVATTNAGANDIPIFLVYDRDTTTGALTLRDSPYDFADQAAGGNLYNPGADGDWHSSNPVGLHIIETFPPTTDAV